MNSPDDDRPVLAREDAELVKRVAEIYAPPSLTASERRDFQGRVLARAGATPARPGLRLLVPIATIAAAAAMAMLWMGRPHPNDSAPISETESTQVSRIAIWEYELINPPELDDTRPQEEVEMLPDEYVAIASLLL